MTASHASSVRNVTAGTGRAVHRTGDSGAYTLCGSEGRTPGSSRLRTVDAEVTCKRCAAIIATDDLRAETAREYLPEATAPAGTSSGAYVPDEDEVDAIAARYGVPADALRAEGDRIMRDRAAALDALPTDDEPVERIAAEVLHNEGDPIEDATGESLGSASGVWTPADAARVEALLDEVEARADAEHAADEEQRDLDAVEPAEVERYRAPSRNRDEDRFRAVHPACGWRSLAWHSNRTVEGRRLAERDAREHRCAEPAEVEEVLAPVEPVHYTREQIAARFDAADEFVLVLGPDDRAYDPETGDTFLGGVTIRYARGEFPGPARTATIVDPDEVLDAEEQRQADADTATGTDADRVTISARASELRPGDLVVDSLGTRQYAAYDVDPSVPGASGTVKVWTAVADQERGLAPVLTLSAGRELLVSRRLTPEQQVEARELFGS